MIIDFCLFMCLIKLNVSRFRIVKNLTLIGRLGSFVVYLAKMVYQVAAPFLTFTRLVKKNSVALSTSTYPSIHCKINQSQAQMHADQPSQRVK